MNYMLLIYRLPSRTRTLVAMAVGCSGFAPR